MTRRVFYLTGTRADFGLMTHTLLTMHAQPTLEVGVLVTGMHLSARYGLTVGDIEATGLPIVARIPVDVDTTTGLAMATAVGEITSKLSVVLAEHRPDVLVLLGDRGEMMAGAIAALYQNIPIVHIHGGELSGTVDEPIRHAISKLSHYHFVATQGARERLIKMGEDAAHIFVTGAPGLDGLTDLPRLERAEWCQQYGFSEQKKQALFLFHPVVQNQMAAAEQAQAALDGVLALGLEVLALMPNADAGGSAIRDHLLDVASSGRIKLLKHLSRVDYLHALSHVAVLVGNSSSGIIEAASFQLPVVNIGSRQNQREQSGNVINVEAVTTDVSKAIVAATSLTRGDWHNVYGDGQASVRITNLLNELSFAPSILEKTNAY
ncbi:MAG: UDP-N-acetylglucosamine 2-epimerase [Agitococcus sp.]|nr:UDP-N-acetylglucosamine 2-epimerase [Agitococcus sp.]